MAIFHGITDMAKKVRTLPKTLTRQDLEIQRFRQELDIARWYAVTTLVGVCILVFLPVIGIILSVAGLLDIPTGVFLSLLTGVVVVLRKSFYTIIQFFFARK
jgi:hypothetical protein